MAYGIKAFSSTGLAILGLLITAFPSAGYGNSNKHPAESIVAQAGDPTAPLAQIQITNYTSNDIQNVYGHTNIFVFEPVIPIRKSNLIPFHQVFRLSLPYEISPNPGSVSGIGDTNLVDLIISPPKPWGIWGAGAVLVLPTAKSDELGDGKWELGPAATFMFYGVQNWQLGVSFQNPVSIAGNSDRDDVNQLHIQPVINYLYKNKWYFGAGDFYMVIDWENDQQITLPLAFQVGCIVQLGKYNYNISAEYEWTAISPSDAIIPERGIRLGFVWLYPE